jgi:hypothetical protein
MSGEQVTDLFERAVATVPPALLAPPHTAIRRRIRRRRAAGWGAATIAAVLVIAGFVVARPGPALVSPAPAASVVPSVVPPTVPSLAPGVPWYAARVDRTGTRITLYAAPLLGKCVERDPGGDELVFADDRVTMFLDGTYTGCADDTQVAQRTFTLPQAVGGRLLVDGRSPAGQQLVFSDTDLPTLPDLEAGDWSEEAPVWGSPGAAVLALRFTRPNGGGPKLRVTPMRWQPEPDGRLTQPDHTLLVDGHQVDIYDRAGSLSAGWWSAAQDVRFTLSTEVPMGISKFDALVRAMTWT